MKDPTIYTRTVQIDFRFVFYLFLTGFGVSLQRQIDYIRKESIDRCNRNNVISIFFAISPTQMQSVKYKHRVIDHQLQSESYN